jgi:UDP-N-acetylmuramate dehydrogenase
VPTLVVGRGSNLLVADAGFAGLAVLLGTAYAAVDIAGADVRAGGAAPLPVVARHTVGAGLTGFEWAVGVPGSIGGAVRMNAGGHGSDMAATLVDATLVDLAAGGDGTGRVVPVADLALGYRRSAVGPGDVVVSATLALAPGDREAGARTLSEIVAWRRENQPGGQNAGSVFTNPPGDSAGRLIDEAGCKGLRHGSAEVSTKHANFFQADPGGSADDIVALMAEVRRRVHDRTGVDLVPETRLVGFPDPQPEPEVEIEG